jgi:hypothetical protein
MAKLFPISQFRPHPYHGKTLLKLSTVSSEAYSQPQRGIKRQGKSFIALGHLVSNCPKPDRKTNTTTHRPKTAKTRLSLQFEISEDKMKCWGRPRLILSQSSILTNAKNGKLFPKHN